MTDIFTTDIQTHVSSKVFLYLIKRKPQQTAQLSDLLRFHIWLGWRDSDPRKNRFNKVVLYFYGVFMPFSGVYMFCKRNSIILNTKKTRSKIWSNYNSLIIKVSSNILSVFYKKILFNQRRTINLMYPPLHCRSRDSCHLCRYPDR